MLRLIDFDDFDADDLAEVERIADDLLAGRITVDDLLAEAREAVVYLQPEPSAR